MSNEEFPRAHPMDHEKANQLQPLPRITYRLVQPYGARREEWTVLSEHSSVGGAFAALDALTRQMIRTGARPDAIEIIVVDYLGDRIERPDPND